MKRAKDGVSAQFCTVNKPKSNDFWQGKDAPQPHKTGLLGCYNAIYYKSLGYRSPEFQVSLHFFYKICQKNYFGLENFFPSKYSNIWIVLIFFLRFFALLISRKKLLFSLAFLLCLLAGLPSIELTRKYFLGWMENE